MGLQELLATGMPPASQDTLPGLPPQRPPAPEMEVRRVLMLRDLLLGLAEDADDVEPLEPGVVAIPVPLFARLVQSRLMLEEMARNG